MPPRGPRTLEQELAERTKVFGRTGSQARGPWPIRARSATIAGPCSPVPKRLGSETL